MAGPHQIWKLDLQTGMIGVWAGSGHENIEDGRPHTAKFAQPSGLATDGEHLFVADSEVSGVRVITGIQHRPSRGRSDRRPGPLQVRRHRRHRRRASAFSTAWAWPTAAASSSSPTRTTTRSRSATPEPHGQDPRRRRQARQQRQSPALLPARRPERGRRQPLRGRHQQPQDPRDRPQVSRGRKRRHHRSARAANREIAFQHPVESLRSKVLHRHAPVHACRAEKEQSGPRPSPNQLPSRNRAPSMVCHDGWSVNLGGQTPCRPHRVREMRESRRAVDVNIASKRRAHVPDAVPDG